MIVAVVVAVCLFAWVLLTIGLTYLAREAEIWILSVPRVLLVTRSPGFKRLIRCGECTSLWTGMGAYAFVLPIGAALLGVPLASWWWLWPLAPLAGVCGVGLFNYMTRTGALGAAYKLAKLLQQGDQEVER